MAYYEPEINPSLMGDITFTYDEMMKWVEEIGRERDKTTANNNEQVARDFIWPFSNGVINNDTIDAIRNGIFDHYNGPRGSRSRNKQCSVVKRFLNNFFDEDTARFVKRLEQNKPRSPRRLNKRILEDDDIRNVISLVRHEEDRTEVQQQHCALLTFLAYTGMRPASANKLKISNIRDTIQMVKPCLLVDDSIDKTFTEHYVPLHPVVVKTLSEVIDGKADDESVFTSYTLLQRFLKDHPTQMINQPSLKVEVRDCRKYMIQKSKVELKLNPEILDYIVSHNTSSLDRKHYTGYKPEVFYDEYMKAWGSVDLLDTPKPDTQTIDLHADDYENVIDEITYCDEDGIPIEEEDVSQLATGEILSRLDVILEESQGLLDLIRTYNRGRADPITVPNELPTSETIRLWLRSEANKLACEGGTTQEEIDECKHDTALELYQRYLDQYNDLMLQSDNRGIVTSEIMYDSHTLIV